MQAIPELQGAAKSVGLRYKREHISQTYFPVNNTSASSSLRNTIRVTINCKQNNTVVSSQPAFLSLGLICTSRLLNLLTQELKLTKSCSASTSRTDHIQSWGSKHKCQCDHPSCPQAEQERAAGHERDSQPNQASTLHPNSDSHHGACVGVSMCGSDAHNTGPSVHKNTSAKYQRTCPQPPSSEKADTDMEIDHNIKSCIESASGIYDIYLFRFILL